MPSSTSQAPDFFAYLMRSLQVLAADRPDAYGAVCAAAGGLRARLVAAGDARVLSFPEGVPVIEGDSPAAVEVVFDDQVILDLIDGRTSLEAALFAERLQIQGAPDAVERFHGALMIYLDGALRVSACLHLLESFRAAQSVAE